MKSYGYSLMAWKKGAVILQNNFQKYAPCFFSFFSFIFTHTNEKSFIIIIFYCKKKAEENRQGQ